MEQVNVDLAPEHCCNTRPLPEWLFQLSFQGLLCTSWAHLEALYLHPLWNPPLVLSAGAACTPQVHLVLPEFGMLFD